ncbi:hypothetical protein PRUPE_7G038400 [Prunus persica]|uniref:RNase H type-1 domain-containing protein n=1 Tax=Prunus persica TaxID=3760 RepID=A0A251N6C5_PRUPE|nr:hypothetical protein PRUPE_7G038400 [Prunus persica]
MDTKVSTLILASGPWDVPKVYSLFTFMEAETILSISLVCDNVDCRIWHFTTHGRYTNFALSHTGIGTSSNPSKKLWKHLWKMKVPAKIQHFFWRFAQNGILTKVVLFYRKIAMDETCFRCSTGCETSVYAVGYFKLNVNGALDLQDGFRGVRLIVRDSHGVLIGAVVMRAPSLLFVFATELYALKVGLSFALDVSLLPLVVESDSLAAVQLLSKEEEYLAPEGVLVTEIRLPFLALSSCVRFVPHTANTVAYRIAHYSL